MNFHVGQKVVCVNDRGDTRGFYYEPQLPKRGSVYTIREIVPRGAYGYDEDGLFLVEIVNPLCIHLYPSGPMKGELQFRVSRFRPVRTTNIDAFLKMLEPTPVHEPVELVPV